MSQVSNCETGCFINLDESFEDLTIEQIQTEIDRLSELADFYEYHTDCEDNAYAFWQQFVEVSEHLEKIKRRKKMSDEDGARNLNVDCLIQAIVGVVGMDKLREILTEHDSLKEQVLLMQCLSPEIVKQKIDEHREVDEIQAGDKVKLPDDDEYRTVKSVKEVYLNE